MIKFISILKVHIWSIPRYTPGSLVARSTESLNDCYIKTCTYRGAEVKSLYLGNIIAPSKASIINTVDSKRSHGIHCDLREGAHHLSIFERSRDG